MPANTPVVAILRMAVDEYLRGEQLSLAFVDADMDMRRAARIRHRFDGAEPVLAVRRGRERAVPLEIHIPPAAAAVSRVHLNPLAIDLPDFNGGVLDRLAAYAEHSAGKMRDLSDRGRRGIADDDQIVVFIERQLVRIVRGLRSSVACATVPRKTRRDKIHRRAKRHSVAN